MANRGYLLISASAHPLLAENGHWKDDARVIGEVKWRTPLFWCTVFNPEEIVREQYTSHIDSDMGAAQFVATVLVLVTTLRLARERAQHRRTVILSLLPARFERIYDAWLGLFDALYAHGYTDEARFYFDTRELWDEDPLDFYQERLEIVTSAFARPDPRVDWYVVLSELGIDYDGSKAIGELSDTEIQGFTFSDGLA